MICAKAKQHRERLENLHKRASLPDSGIVWDETKATMAVTWLERFVRHYQEPHAGKPLRLEPWQKDDIVRPLFGFRRPDGTRLFREAYIQIPRKNGKSFLVAALLLYVFYNDGEGLEVYCAATSSKQAHIIFQNCVAIVEQSPALRKSAKILNHEIWLPKKRSVLRPISADKKQHGFNLSACSIDELHLHPNPELHDLLITSTGARTQPLILKITTAGDDLNSVCYSQYSYAEKILAGTIRNDSFFCFITEADKNLPWDSPDAYKMANPNLNVSIDEKEIVNRLDMAKNIPIERLTYERLYLNRWVAQKAEKFINLTLWNQNKQIANLEGRDCYGGLDLSSNADLTAFSLIFPDKDTLHLRTWFWLPDDNLTERSRKDGVPYDIWAIDKHITTTPGNVIDYEYIYEFLVFLRGKYNIKRIAYDNWNATQLSIKLEQAGFDLVQFVQGLKSFHTPTMELDRLIRAGKLKHDGNPCLSWCMGNVETVVDASGKIRPVKSNKSSIERIDGAIASIMALDCYTRSTTEPEKQKNSLWDYTNFGTNITKLYS